MSFIAGLECPNVFRMARPCIVGEWLTMEGAGIRLRTSGTPEWFPRSNVILLVRDDRGGTLGA